MFDFIHQQALTSAHFDKDDVIEWLIDSYIAKESVTLIYSQGGGGKSIIATATSLVAANKGMNVIYIDFDNSKLALRQRKIKQKLIDPCPTLTYLHRSTATMTALQVIEQLHAKAVGDSFKNTFIVLDSLKNFFDLNNDNKANEAMRLITNIRDAGATVLILSHTNKSGNNYQGSNNIRDALDSMFSVEKLESDQGILKVILTVEKERLPVVDTAISVNTHDLTMLPIDITEARITLEDREFIEDIKITIAKNPGINKRDLLDDAGYSIDNKTHRKKLEQFEDLYWKTEKGNKNATFYHLI